MNTYSPQVNDYVIWNNNKGIKGWVYYKCNQYLTIEALVRPKDELNYACSPIHANNRLLVMCYYESWNELVYVKSRQSVYEEI